jgi:cell division protease FtsH
MAQKDDLNPPPADSNGGKNSSKDNKPNAYVFWYLLAAGIVLALMLSLISSTGKGTKVVYSEFVAGLNSGKYNPSNVHDMVYGVDALTFHDKSMKSAIRDLVKADPAEPKSDSASNSSTSKEVKRFYVPVSSMSSGERDALAALLRDKRIQFEYESAPTELQTLFPLLLLIVSVIFLIFIIRRLGGTGAAMSFGRSRGKLYAQDDVRTTFANVAGIDEAVDELKEIVDFLKTPEKYQALGGRIPRGVLLVGPPGTGKTLLAKAVAGEAGVPFFGLSGSDFVEMFVGVGAARVRDMFAQAVQRSPSIIFIDELDALGKVRGSGMPGGQDEREQTLNALLVEMDGFSSDKSVIVMGATNRPETLDPALMRPGRFDRHVLVDKPDYKGRESILKVHSSKVRMDDTVNFYKIAKLTPGFSGADLANLVNEAALLAARGGKKMVGMKEFEEAIERVIAGLEKTTRIISPEEKQRVAFHECGHALIACSLPNTDPVHKISIIPRGFGALGYMLQRPQDDRHLVTQSELRNKISVLLGGIGAEDIIYKETSTGASNDLERATDLARRMVTEFGMSPKLGRVNYHTSQRNPFLGTASGSSDYMHSESTIREIDLEIKRIIDETMNGVLDILRDRRQILDHMAKDLMEMEVMDSDHLDSILQQYKTGPQIKPGTYAPEPSGDAVSSQDLRVSDLPPTNQQLGS